MTFDRLHTRLAKTWHRVVRLFRRLLGIKNTVYVQERVPFYREIWRAAAMAKGLEFAEYSESIWQINESGEPVARINNYVVSLDDPVTLNIAGDKLVTYRILDDEGLTIPRHAAVSMGSLATIRQFMEDVPGPYVIKPARNTSSGIGVTTALSSIRDCLSAAGLAFAYCDEILIEEHVIGESYRLVFLGNDMVCASRRTGLRVRGDGINTLERLIEARCGAAGTRDDAEVKRTIARQRLLLDSVPAAGADILIRSSAEPSRTSQEIRTVYSEDVTDAICSEVVDEARRASLALGSEFCGVDIITVDPTKPLGSGAGFINEINTTPGLHHHYNLDGSGPREPLAETVLAYFLKKRSSASSPSLEESNP